MYGHLARGEVFEPISELSFVYLNERDWKMTFSLIAFKDKVMVTAH